MAPLSYILVTGSTGLIGAWVVDLLLEKGLRVRGTVRSMAKAEAMLAARPQWQDKLDFVEIADFEGEPDLSTAVDGVDGIIHTASPFRYDIKDNARELVLPAINGVKALFSAAATQPGIQRVVLTSSFAAVIDISRTASAENKDFIYTSNDWNPLSFEEAIDPAASPVVAYRGSKKFAEIEAWDFVRNNQTPFALVTICPPMVFGPVANPISSPSQLNESNAQLWKVATNPKTLPETRVPLWIDVRDLAKIHVHALLSPQAGGKRLTAASPERFSYGLAAQILRKRLPHLARHSTEGESEPEESYQLDGLEAAKMFGIQYTKFETTVVDFLRQVDSWT